MPSTNSNKVKFSMEDFEKGLMLLGLVSPINVQEYKEKNELDEYEKDLSRKEPNIYFKRVVLAAEIVTHLREEKTFGRIKFQKLVYICEHVTEMKVSQRYAKFEAGPFDRKFMFSINNEFKKQKWFDVIKVKDGNYLVPKYVPLANCDSYKKYYSNYFSEFDEHIQSVISLFRHKLTSDTELAATILACVLEIVETSSRFDWADLLAKFYSWHDKKKRFTETQILTSFKWLKEHSLLPAVDVE